MAMRNNGNAHIWPIFCKLENTHSLFKIRVYFWAGKMASDSQVYKTSTLAVSWFTFFHNSHWLIEGREFNFWIFLQNPDSMDTFKIHRPDFKVCTILRTDSWVWAIPDLLIETHTVGAFTEHISLAYEYQFNTNLPFSQFVPT